MDIELDQTFVAHF
jgi:hypothetical protein